MGKLGKKDVEFCLTAFWNFERHLRDLAFHIATATGRDEIYFATEDAIEIDIEDLKKCMPAGTHSQLEKQFRKLGEFEWVSENASDVMDWINTASKTAFNGLKEKLLETV